MHKKTEFYFSGISFFVSMRKFKKNFSCLLFFLSTFLLASGSAFPEAIQRITHVEIVGNMFYINEVPTYQNRVWTAPNGENYVIEGLLMNSRMVQGIFDDLNPETRKRWAYPDTNEWDPERNTKEFIKAMPKWRKHGMLAFTLNLQGGSPEGYSREQPWHNSTFTGDGSLRPEYVHRLEKIIDRSDELGMVVILGYFYFGQDERLIDEKALVNGVDNITTWLLEKGYRNVVLPHVKLIHHESKSRGHEDNPEKQQRFQKEISIMLQRWQHRLTDDPCYNPNLTFWQENFNIKGEEELRS